MTDLFQAHDRDFQSNRYVYPVISRRSRGLSIGINLSPTARCTFDCAYCMVERAIRPEAPLPDERRAPSTSAGLDLDLLDLERLEAELEAMVSSAVGGGLYGIPPFDETPASLRRFNDIALSGNGEATLSPQFGEVCALATRALGEARPEEHTAASSPKVVVITNATLLHLPRVRQALERLDARRSEIWAKLDAGTPDHYRRVNRSRVPFERVLGNLMEMGRLRPLVIQSMFFEMAGRAPDEREIEAWLDRLETLRRGGAQLDRVQIYTVARRTRVRETAPLSEEELANIAARVASLGIASEWFGSAMA